MRKLIIILAFLGIYSFASAQLKDVQLWVGPVLKYNLGQKFRFEIEQQFRFNENISQFDYTFSEFGLRYKVFKYLNVKAIYRYSFMSSGQTGSALDEYDKSRISFSASTGTEIFNTGINVGYRILWYCRVATWRNLGAGGRTPARARRLGRHLSHRDPGDRGNRLEHDAFRHPRHGRHRLWRGHGNCICHSRRGRSGRCGNRGRPEQRCAERRDVAASACRARGSGGDVA